MIISTLLGAHVDPEFTRACERAQGYKDYPYRNNEYRHSAAYEEGYCARYKKLMDDREEEAAQRGDGPIEAYKSWRDREDA